MTKAQNNRRHERTTSVERVGASNRDAGVMRPGRLASASHGHAPFTHSEL